MKKGLKALLTVLLILVLIPLLAAAGLVGWLSLTEFKPAERALLTRADALAGVETDGLAGCRPQAALRLQEGAQVSVLSWNIGYAGLGAGESFLLDGGEKLVSADEAAVERYLAGIGETLREQDCDLVLLQEVDRDCARTYGIDEAQRLAFGDSWSALNYSSPFVPNPNTLLIDSFGRIHSGLLTSSRYEIAAAERISLPCPFSWPLRAVNLKRCLLVTRLPIGDGGRELVLVNLHLEAYDDGEGKLAQTRQLMDFLAAEYAKGNCVVAGGDFNQVFPGALEVWPNAHPENWTPGALEEAWLPEGFRYVCDLTVPSCRLLNQPYDPSDTENTQHYVIDGFIVSANVAVLEAKGVDLGFADADHNPVRLRLRLGGAPSASAPDSGAAEIRTAAAVLPPEPCAQSWKRR